MKRIVVIFNRHSGPTDRFDEIKAFFDSLPEDRFDVRFRSVDAHNDASNIAKECIAEKFDVVIGAGGDGTLNAIASHLIDTQMEFGILPTGTLNHLAKDLGIPLDLQLAMSLIAEAHDVIKIDAGNCNGAFFLNNSGLGIYPRIVTLREKFQKRGHVKSLAYLLAFFHVIRRIPKFFVTLKIDDEIISKRTSFVFVGNNAYGLGGLATGTRDSLCDGKLSLWISHRTSFLGLAGLLIRALVGNVKEHRDFDVFEAKELTVETKNRNVTVSFDGEIETFKSPLNYKIMPACLNVIVPIKEKTI